MAQETSSSPKPNCQSDDATKCRVVLNSGAPAPFAGVLLTTPLAAELAARMQQCLATIDAEKEKAQKLIELEQKTCVDKLAVVERVEKEKQDILKAALKKSQERELDLDEALAQEQANHLLWAVGGAAGGVLLGISLTAGAVLYLTIAP